MRNECFLTKSLIAHRGLHDVSSGIIETSIESFKLAIDKKYIIELDVHVLKDGEIVVFHDDNLYRITGVNKNISECTYNEIKDLKLKNINSYIPKLEEVLKLVDGRVPLLIEIKNNSKVGIFEENLAEILDTYKGDFAIQSFNPFVINWFKKYRPQVLRGQLAAGFKSENVIKRFFLKNMVLNIFTKPDFISYAVNDLSLEKVKSIRKKRLLLGWTVKTDEQKEKYIKEYDNLICENIL